MQAIIHIDGGSRGNPGPAAFACVIQRMNAPVVEHYDTMGTATNNVAEYTALLEALAKAHELGATDLEINSDSELLVKQMTGQYKVKNEELRDLYLEAKELAKNFKVVKYQHVRREFNKRADELCNIALDREEKARRTAQAPKPSRGLVQSVNDVAVRGDAVEVLENAAKSWAKGNANNPPVEAVWEQLWSLLEEHQLLKRK
jgi:ribonuclease HI